MKKMTPEIYEEKRNELIALLEGILKKATKIPDESRKELQDTVGKLKRNSFEITLVGEFQGGKSTLFDTILEGREISPRGQGIKTSACKISAQSVPEEAEEYVNLRWKTDDELMLTMLDIVKANLIDDAKAYALFEQKKDDGSTRLPSLSDKKIRHLAKKALEKEWEIYNKNPSYYDPDDSGRLDLLQISTLILNFYDSKELVELRSKTRVSLAELKSLVVFPKNWLMRWQEGKEKTKWSFDEIRFVFLGDAEVYIHSDNLERLGCVVTDCPGLFAGPWDTMVAENAMIRADAILFLMRGDRAISDSELRALGHIKKTNQEHKLFLAINARKSKNDVETLLRPADFAMIKQRGFTVDSEQALDVYNGLLGFNSRCTQPPSDIEEKDRDEWLRNWRNSTGRAIATYYNYDMFEDVDKIKALMENKEELYRGSGVLELLSKIEASVVLRKFESILVKGGTEKASASLDALNGELKAKENAASKSLEEAEYEVGVAREKLEKFQKFVNDEVGRVLEDATSADLLAQDFLNEVYVKNIREMSDSISFKLKCRFNQSKRLLEIVWDLMKAKVKSWTGHCSSAKEDAEKRAKSILTEPVVEAVEEVATPAASGWLANIRDNGNKLFETAYGRALKSVGDRVRSEWDRMFEGETSILSGLALDFDISLSPIGHTVNKLYSEDGVNVQKEAASVLVKKISAMIGAVVVAIVTTILVAFIMVNIGLGGLPAILVILAGLFSGGAFFEFVNEKIVNNLEIKLRPDISQKLTELFSEQQEKIKSEAKEEIISGIVKELKEKLRNSLRVQAKKFEARVKEMLSLKKETLEEQQRVAAEAKEVREKQIEPARKEIVDFNNSLAPYFT